MKNTLLIALLASFAAVGCGGGDDGDQGPNPTPPAPYSVLFGTDPVVRASYQSCSDIGVDTHTIVVTPRESGISLDFRDRQQGVSEAVATLTYVSGNNESGFRFNGSLRNQKTGQVAEITSAILKNTSTTGELNLNGSMVAVDRGCKSGITFFDL